MTRTQSTHKQIDNRYVLDQDIASLVSISGVFKRVKFVTSACTLLLTNTCLHSTSSPENESLLAIAS